MFAKIAGFEFRYQLRQPIFWIGLLLFALLAFGAVASSNIQIGSSDNVHKNAAFAIAQACLAFAVIYTFVVVAFVANVIVRDDDTGFGAIIRTTPIRKFEYLFGRFTGAFAAAALAFLAVPIGLWLGSLAPWVDKETLGPLVFGNYVYAYGVLALPILFLSSALFFTLTTLTRSMMWTYVGLIALLIIRSVSAVILTRPGLEHVSALWEPFGTSAFGAATRYWTASERNALMPSLAGDLLWNKVLWLGVACGVLALAHHLFSFQSAERSGRRKPSAAIEPVTVGQNVAAPMAVLAKPSFGAATTWAQLWARTRLDARQVFFSPAYFVLLGLAALLAGLTLWLATDVSGYGGRIFPVTRVMIDTLSTFDFFALIIAIYYAGELVWREKELRTQEIIDATPVADWMFVGPKTVAISFVLISTLFVGVVVAIVMQAVRGYFHFEIGKYLLWWVLPHGIDFVLLAALAIFVQTLSPHKYVGWAVMAVYLISTIVLDNLGFEHHLYRYGGGPDVPLSDMDGQGRYWIGAYWFRLYWSAFALILLVLSHGLWRRGSETLLAPRLRALPRRLHATAGVILAIAVATFVGSGAFIFYNTNILNPYHTQLDDERWAADFEKKFLHYESVPEPKVAAVKLNIQIFPREPRLEAQGSYVIQNRTAAPLSVMHVRFPRDLLVDTLTIEGAHLQTQFAGYGYRIYAFDRPMQPGETRTLSFSTTFAQHGFRNNGDIRAVVDNGTFINDQRVVPHIGMDRGLLLQDRARRRKYGLPPELRMPKLGTAGADQVNYLRHDADWVTADITVTTDGDQIPIAPGQAVSQSVKDGRRTVRFVTDSPIMDFFSAQSARYTVATQAYKGVQISVYYDARRPWNVARIENAMRAGLDYYQANFGPYQFHQVRVLEFPAPQGDFAQSYANTIAWSEGIFFIADTRDPTRVDMVTYVGAHELAHQWWAHQIIGADEQGSTALSETLAQYSAAMVMKHMYGPYLMRKFLKFELDGYLRSRAGDVLEEEPLERVENQQYIHYRKGSLVMYRLQDEVGEDVVNRALRHLLRDFAFKGPPYPTSLDLVRDLRAEAPADMQQLITDLFEKITLYDVKASRAVATQRSDGRYDLTFTVDAKKLYAEGQGHESPAPMDETLDVGAFDVEPGHAGYDASKVIAVQKLRIHSGVQTVTLTLGRRPKFAGVDPFNELIDRNSEATITKVAAH
ncbi:MAG TPA: M1 family aminopeptidase [Steroidobacteraceae bacterium]|nr:M1 family aminopeptidase [Steroidobacteraceae bacterium]